MSRDSVATDSPSKRAILELKGQPENSMCADCGQKGEFVARLVLSPHHEKPSKHGHAVLPRALADCELYGMTILMRLSGGICLGNLVQTCRASCKLFVL